MRPVDIGSCEMMRALSRKPRQSAGFELVEGCLAVGQEQVDALTTETHPQPRSAQWVDRLHDRGAPIRAIHSHAS